LSKQIETPAKSEIRVAIAGNPNSGKTSIFNSITGSRQHVANYPGATVERKEGAVKRNGVTLRVTDLPGTYSLTAASPEEIIARNFILDEKPDVVVTVLDASNLERNLYLVTEIMELGVPVVHALNMSDVAETRGIRINRNKLSKRLGAPIVPTVGNRGEGIEELLEAVARTAQEENGRKNVRIDYGSLIEREVGDIQQVIEGERNGNGNAPVRWLSLKLLEGDREIKKRIPSETVLHSVELSKTRVGDLSGHHPQIALAERRYEFISQICRGVVSHPDQPGDSFSDRIDTIVTHRFLGLPIFLALMYLVFQLTFTVGAIPMTWIESFFGWLGEGVSSLWAPGSASALRSLLVDGIIGGVGGVLVFLPNILLLFLAISFLEDTGYMARAAFIMDRIMHKVGLHGKSFIPLLTGFGCSIPGIMATRTLENRRDRLTTMLVLPLMSCGARLPIYALIIPAFFAPPWQAPMLWTIYVIGILLAIVSAKLLRGTMLRGDPEPFVMELPPYHLPTPKSVLIQMWERSWLYLKKAGTVILGISIVLWFLTSYPKLPAQTAEAQSPGTLAVESVETTDSAALADELAYSAAGRIGHAMEPVIAPMGFDWKIGTALIGAIAAKEVFVAQMGIVYSVGETDEESEALRFKLREAYPPLVGFCIMLFALIASPCMATFAVTRRESGSWKWALLQWGGLTILAYVLTVAIFQLGSLLGLGTG
jgi:ferrous iron transport protein B